MDHSFVVLPKQRNQVQGVPPRSGGVQPNSSQFGKAMEESFVVLPPPAASVYQCESTSDEGGVHLSSQGGMSSPVQSNNSGLHSTITVLKRAFGIATTQMQVFLSIIISVMEEGASVGIVLLSYFDSFRTQVLELVFFLFFLSRLSNHYAWSA